MPENLKPDSEIKISESSGLVIDYTLSVQQASSETPPLPPSNNPDSSDSKSLSGMEVPLNQILEITTLESSEKTYSVPAIRVLFSSKEETRRVAHLALALDSIGAAILPILVDSSEAECTGLDDTNLLSALSEVSLLPTLKAVTLGGSAPTLIGLAVGELDQNENPEDLAKNNNSLISALATRHYLDPAIAQSLREARSSSELLQLISRSRLGWLFDEICRLACVQIRKRLDHPVTIETIAFGNSGAVLGRASLEPGNFEI
ncbi:MAG TPA: hypothetical protein VH186_12840 [Chloroflexia bacterium]|nr:hypothetical protein [Chloroflexia bacterium]